MIEIFLMLLIAVAFIVSCFHRDTMLGAFLEGIQYGACSYFVAKYVGELWSQYVSCNL